MYDIEKYLIFRYENGIIFWKDSPSLEKYTKIFTDEVIKYVVFLEKECEVGEAEGRGRRWRWVMGAQTSLRYSTFEYVWRSP